MSYTIKWQYPGDDQRSAIADSGVAANQLVHALKLSGAAYVSVESEGAARHAKPRVDEPLIGRQADLVRDVIRTWKGPEIGDPNQP